MPNNNAIVQMLGDSNQKKGDRMVDRGGRFPIEFGRKMN